MSEDKPKIRLHRYERILAVKWPGNEHWLMIWPDPDPDLAPPGKPAAQTEWNRLAGDDELDSAARTIRGPSSEQETWSDIAHAVMCDRRTGGLLPLCIG